MRSIMRSCAGVSASRRLACAHSNRAAAPSVPSASSIAFASSAAPLRTAAASVPASVASAVKNPRRSSGFNASYVRRSDVQSRLEMA